MLSRDRPDVELDPPEWLHHVVEEALGRPGLSAWVPSGSFRTSSLVRVPRFPESIEGSDVAALELSGVRNERRSAQLAVASTEPLEDLACSVADLRSDRGTIPADAITARFVDYVPVKRARSELKWSASIEEVADRGVSGDRAPDVIGDPLVDRDAVDVPPYQAQPIWLTVDIPEDVPPGTYEGAVTITAADEDPVRYELELTVQDLTLPDPMDYGFHLDVWMNPNAVATAHDVPAWSEDHWERLEPYFADLASRGQAAITATIIEKPWLREWLEGTWRSSTETGYGSMVEWRHDGESWSFDYSVFDRYVETARRHGVGPYITAFSMLVFRGPQRLTYTDLRSGESVTERVEAGSDRWRGAWSAFLPDFADHLRGKGWLEHTLLAFDERPADLMEEAFSLIREVEPAFEDRIAIAGSLDVEPYCDYFAANSRHVPEIPLDASTIGDPDDAGGERLDDEIVAERRREGKLTTFYVAGQPPHPNLFSFSPSVEGRLLPWIAASAGLDGFLRWSYTSWPGDVFREPVFRYIQGDEYLVYPGQDGPTSSVRWELLRDGIQDYELASMAREDDSIDGSDLQEAFDIALGEVDGREKDVRDVPRARDRIVDLLTE